MKTLDDLVATSAARSRWRSPKAPLVHREQASVDDVTQLLPAYSGGLVRTVLGSS